MRMRAALTVIILASTLTLCGSTATHAEPLPPISIPEIELPEVPGSSR